MNDINRPSVNNMGGLARFKLCPENLISNVPDAVSGVIAAQVTFESGGRWYDFFSTLETLFFEQTSSTTNQGKAYKQIVGCFLPGQSANLDTLFSELEQMRHILKLYDTNGHILLMCSKKGGTFTGARMTVDYNSQSKISGRKGYAIQFELWSHTRAYFYTATETSGSGS